MAKIPNIDVTDLTGKVKSRMVMLEKRTLGEQKTDVLVVPDHSMFLGGTLKVYDGVTNQELVLGRDFIPVGMDTKGATESGVGVYKAFLVKKPKIKHITYSYYVVGGEYYLGVDYINTARKILIDLGDKGEIPFDTILGKPDWYTPAQHLQPIQDFYGYDVRISSLDAMTAALTRGIDETFAVENQNAINLLTSLEVETNQAITDTEANKISNRDRLRVQDGEHIYTDDLSDPAIKRGYGKWERVEGILAATAMEGTGSTLIGDKYVELDKSDNNLGVRNTVIWRNKGAEQDYSLKVSFVGKNLLNGGYTLKQGEVVDLKVEGRGYVIGTTVTIDLKDLTDLDLTFTNGSPTVTLDSQGMGTVSVTVGTGDSSTSTKRGSIGIRGYGASWIPLTIMYTSLKKSISAYFSASPSGNEPVSSVLTVGKVYLCIRYTNYKVGEPIALDWSQSNSLEMFKTPPSLISSSTASSFVSLEINEDIEGLTSSELVVYVKPAGDMGINSNHAMATVKVMRVDKYVSATIDITDTNGTPISNLDEGSKFQLRVKCDQPNTNLYLDYFAGRDLRNFKGLVNDITTDHNGYWSGEVTLLEDYRPQGLVEFFEAVVTTGTPGYHPLDRAVVMINDTSQALVVKAHYTTPPDTTPITTVEEGKYFVLHISALTWAGSGSYPRINLDYKVNGLAGVQAKELLKSRVVFGFYDSLEFGPGSSVLPDVDWDGVNGVLSLKLFAIDDKFFGGDLAIEVVVTPQYSTKPVTTPITVLDTSVMTVVGTWSSSATRVEPITQISEMDSNGDNSTCYIIMDADGDGSLFGDITLEASGTANAKDYVEVFPKVVRFAKGASRNVVVVNIVSDWLTEGDKVLTITGSFMNPHMGKTELFSTSITIVDTSITILGTVKYSTSPTDPNAAPPGGMFSEWYPFYGHFETTPIGVDTTMDWADINKSLNLVTSSGVIDMAKGQTKVVFTVTPKEDFATSGIKNGPILVRRYLKAQPDKRIMGDISTPVSINDDSVPLSMSLQLWRGDGPLKVKPNVVYEGDQEAYAEVIVGTPFPNSVLAVEVRDIRDNVVGSEFRLGSMGSVVDFPSAGMVDYVFGNVITGPVTVKVPIKFKRNRTTALAATQVVLVDAWLVKNPKNWKVGDRHDLVGTQLSRGTECTVIDDSRTLETDLTISINGGPPGKVFTVGEGDSFTINITYDNAEVGDVFNIQQDINDRSWTRYKSHQWGLEQVVTATKRKGVMVWKFELDPNYSTNNKQTLHILVAPTHSYLGALPTKLIYVRDTFITPILWAVVVEASNPNVASPTAGLDEGKSYELVVLANESFTHPLDKLVVSYTELPARIVYDAPIQGTFVMSPGDPFQTTSSWKYHHRLPFRVTADYKTNPAEQMIVDLTTVLTNASQRRIHSLNDITRTPTVSNVSWRDQNNQNISSIDEGAEARLYVKFNGGHKEITMNEILVENAEGRSLDLMIHADYGKRLTVNSPNGDITAVFKSQPIYKDNVGNDARLRVKLTHVASGVDLGTYELPINDVYRNTSATVEYFKDGVSIFYVEEGEKFDVVYTITDPSLNDRYVLSLNPNTGNPPTHSAWTLNETTTPTRAEINARKLVRKYTDRYVPEDGTTNGADGGNFYTLIGRVTSNAPFDNWLLSIRYLNVQDVSIAPLTSAYFYMYQTANTIVSAVNEGDSFDLYLDPAIYDACRWDLGYVMAWEAISVYDQPIEGMLQTFKGTIAQNDFAPDRSFRTTLQAIANESTNTSGRMAMFKAVITAVKPGRSHVLAKTQNLKITDTSVTPSIDDVYYSTNESGSLRVSKINEGTTIYLQVEATGLSSREEDVTINLNYTGSTVNNADFDPSTPLPPTLVMKCVNTKLRKWKGTYMLIVIEDYRPG